MQIDLSGRTALVCGASEGLGYASAYGLARAGANLAICSRSADKLAIATANLAKHDTEVVAIKANLTSTPQIDELASRTLEHFGVIDILVNNAGGPPPGTFDDLTEADWRSAVDLTLMSAVELTRRILPGMRSQKWGRIVNITSTSVKQPVDGLILSNSIRMAVVGWAKALANEVGPDQVVINNVCPGYTTTDRLGQLAANIAARDGIEETKVFENWAGTVPLRRLASPEEFANVVVFLASEQAAYVHGTTIAVDGGRSQSVT